MSPSQVSKSVLFGLVSGTVWTAGLALMGLASWDFCTFASGILTGIITSYFVGQGVARWGGRSVPIMGTGALIIGTVVFCLLAFAANGTPWNSQQIGEAYVIGIFEGILFALAISFGTGIFIFLPCAMLTTFFLHKSLKRRFSTDALMEK